MSEVRAAATLALARNGPRGIEVLLLERTRDAVFLPGFHVFPGGALDDSDGADPFRKAALRECFEEAGILLVRDGHGDLAVHTSSDVAVRGRIDGGMLTLDNYCAGLGLEPAMESLIYLGRWITPPGPPRRFDTHFFLARVPQGQPAFPDGTETVSHVWLTPEEAIRQHCTGERLFVPPTLSTLRRLNGYNDVATLEQRLRSQLPDETLTRPWPAMADDGPVILEPGQSDYDEVRVLDPEAKGHLHLRMPVSEPIQLTQRVTRLTAANPGVMTGPGTNTYLVRDGAGFMVIDPGPHDEAHLKQILSLTDGRIHHVLVTHSHPDHAPGAGLLQERTGATIVGLAPPGFPEHVDRPRPDLEPVDGHRLGSGPGQIRVLHTPGHASNHLAFLLESEGILFAGDLLMQDSTVVINPPDGDMSDYLNSLKRLLDEPLNWLYPGHGRLMAQPQAVLDYLITHRHMRERRVLGALRSLGRADERLLLARVYSDVDAAMHPVAARSLKAHLLKLEKDGIAVQNEGIWSIIG